MTFALILIGLVLAALWGWTAWARRRREAAEPEVEHGEPEPTEWCDTCGGPILGDYCKIVQQGTQSEDGIAGGWAMVAYFHPIDGCCPIPEMDEQHEHAGA